MSDDNLPTAADTIYGGVTTIVKGEEFSKAETALLQSNALTVDDADVYQHTASADGKGTNIIQPTYRPIQMSSLTHENNTLFQCVTAMEVNIDGTGYEISRKDGEVHTEQDAETIQGLRDFFDEPYPCISFTTMRRYLRRDLESTGNGYLEVIRDVEGEITFLQHLDANLTAMVRLDKPVQVSTEITRLGRDKTVNLYKRERRFAQKINNKMVYYREFGSSRQLDRITGYWEGDPRLKETEALAPDGTILPARRATEIIHFRVVKDVKTSYGVPRWVNNIPSVLGGRKAEEMNLDFFNSGGLPPAMVIIQGGSLSGQARKDLTSYLAAPAKNKQRGVLFEVFSTSGEIGKSGGVQVKVERFGSEKQSDAMFMKYDERTREHIRVAFRLPPLFLGLSEDYNFATAYTAYIVAEAQVFAPERTEFDEAINVKIMKELAPDYVFRSLPISVTDVEQQLKAMGMVKDFSEKEDWVKGINDIASIETIYEEPEPVEVAAPVFDNLKKAATILENDKIVKVSDTFLSDLCKDWADYSTGAREFSEDSVSAMRGVIASMDEPVKELMKSHMATHFAADTPDTEGPASKFLADASLVDG